MTPGARTRRLRNRRLAAAVAGAAAVIAGLAVGIPRLEGGAGSPANSTPQLTPAATVAAFVHSYVRADGRVVRTDQGGDTVSEGQAYGMLMTAVVGDKPQFMAVWAWTRAHLLLPDGLLAWHWAHGAVVGRQPASDADLGVAAALVMGSQRFGDPSLLTDAHRIADAILAHETAPSAEGPTLVAGPWAVSPTEYVDPSYLAPAELSQLVSAFGGEWSSIESTSIAQLETLTANGDLPSNWAVIGPDHAIHPAAPPNAPGSPASFGFDAVRTPVWMALSCNAELRSSAAALLPALERGGGEVGLNLGGHPAPGVANPVGRVALAAAQWAAGQRQQAWGTLADAARAEQSHPSYYGSAWVALTTLGFDGRLESCAG